MGSYGPWSRKRELRRLTWVCGNEAVLVEDVVTEALSRCAGHVSFTAGEDPESAIWDAVSSPLADPGARQLVIIRAAQKLRRWDCLGALAPSRELDGVWALFVSGEERLAQVRDGESGKSVLAPHLALLRDSRAGLLVECRVAGDWRETPEWLLEWASRQLGGAGRVLGDCLLAASGHSLGEAAATGRKLHLAGLEPTREVITGLSSPAGSYAEALACGRPREALEAAGSLSHEETGRAIALLASRLDVLGALHAAQARRLDARDTAVKLGVPQFLQARYKNAAQAYGSDRVASCRSLLAVADEAWRSGAGAGIPEFVAALWAA